MYEDQHSSARQGRPAQGQRCPACGNLDPDPLARFCGVCGTTLGAAAPMAAPPARYAPPGPPVAAYAPALSPASVSPILPRSVYAVPSINLVGAGQIGAAISAVFGLVPCLLFAAIGARLVSDARWVLDSWTTASFRVPVPVVAIDVPVNYIDLFRLRALYNFVIYWDDRIWLTFALLFLVPWIFSIVSGALFGGTLAVIYNAVGKASGGMRVTLTPTGVPPTGQPVQQATWAAGPPAGPPPDWSSQDWPAGPRR